jgi:anthranilate phosphoribosyltransferase
VLNPALAFRPQFEKVASGAALSEEEARQAFLCIMQGSVSEVELSAFLVAMKARGETVDEISGAASAMRELMIGVSAPEEAIDIVGTGGDAQGTFNISTAAAFVLAGGGVPVAKHGNRAVSSKSGAADVLERLGVKIETSPRHLARCFERAGLAFLWAPAHHPAMRHAAPVRQGLRLRTIFNLLGPLLNPAGTRRQLIGTYAEEWLVPMAEATKRGGARHVWVVHGAGGMDELSTTGTSRVVQLKDGRLDSFEVHPSEAGIPLARMEDLRGGGPEENAAALRALLRGERGPYRDIVLLNAGAALIIAGKAETLPEGVGKAAASIDEGRALAALEALIAASQEPFEEEPHFATRT